MSISRNKGLRLKLFMRGLGVCHYCKKDLDFNSTQHELYPSIDHLKTLRDGRKNYMDGGHVISCDFCNKNRDAIKYFNEIRENLGLPKLNIPIPMRPQDFIELNNLDNNKDLKRLFTFFQRLPKNENELFAVMEHRRKKFAGFIEDWKMVIKEEPKSYIFLGSVYKKRKICSKRLIKALFYYRMFNCIETEKDFYILGKTIYE